MSTTIVLPYSIGQTVWFMSGNKINSHKIMAYRISSSKDGNEYAVIKYIDKRYGYLKEDEIFPSKEELIKSLL